MKARSERTCIEQDDVVRELAKIAFANLGDYFRIGPDGLPALDLANMTRDQAAGLRDIVAEEYTTGRGEAARRIKRFRIKLGDKLAALDRLGKHLGMFNTESPVTIQMGSDVPAYTDTERFQRWLWLLTRGGTRPIGSGD